MPHLFDPLTLRGLALANRVIVSPMCEYSSAGRTGSTAAPWKDRAAVPPSNGGWQPVGPTGEPFAPNYPVPRALDTAEIPAVVAAFKDAAHGYLIHQFLSPLSNHRTDPARPPAAPDQRCARC